MHTALLSQAIRSLPPYQREVLTETVFRKRSVNEAARHLGLPVEVVKSRVYEALCTLRAASESSSATTAFG